jgi:hypothetical protein
MTDYYNQQIHDPNAPPGQEKKNALPYGHEAQEDLDPTEIPSLAVNQPWEEVSGEERGEALQEQATTVLGEQFKEEEYDIPEEIRGDPGYVKGPGFLPSVGKDAKSPNILAALGRSAGMTALQSGIGAGIGHLASSSGGGAGAGGAGAGGGAGASAGASNVGASALGTTASGMMIGAGAMYTGYTMGPMAAAFESQHMGGYSPGYASQSIMGPLNYAAGARTDKEAKQRRGQRIGSMGTGAAMGAGTGAAAGSVVPGLGTGVGAVIGAVAGTVGGFLSKNPETGDRGYEEAWKYNIKPIGVKLGKDINMKSYGDAFQGKFSKDMIPGTNKDGWLKNLTNWKNLKGQVKSMIPGMGGMGGGGKKPPNEKEVKKGITRDIAKNVNLDYQIQEWWNKVVDKGSAAGREYVKGGLETEGREWSTDENLPDWALKGTAGKKKYREQPDGTRQVSRKAWQYGPEEIGGKRVASQHNVNTLAGLQAQLEKVGNRKKFWNEYMKDYNMWQEGGAGLSDKWHGKRLYNVPSQVSGLKPNEMWSDIDFQQDYSKNLDWLQMQEEEEGEG